VRCPPPRPGACVFYLMRQSMCQGSSRSSRSSHSRIVWLPKPFPPGCPARLQWPTARPPTVASPPYSYATAAETDTQIPLDWFWFDHNDSTGAQCRLPPNFNGQPGTPRARAAARWLAGSSLAAPDSARVVFRASNDCVTLVIERAAEYLVDVTCRNASFFEFSLRWSRACLGKKINCIYKWRKRTRFDHYPVMYRSMIDRRRRRRRHTHVHTCTQQHSRVRHHSSMGTHTHSQRPNAECAHHTPHTTQVRAVGRAL
jgi:hypothetical protein